MLSRLRHWDIRLTRTLQEFKRYDFEMFSTGFYLNCAFAFMLPVGYVSGILMDIISFGVPRETIAIMYLLLFIIQLYGLWHNIYTIRKLGLGLYAFFMSYFAIAITERSGVTIASGLLTGLAMFAILTLWRFTANESSWPKQSKDNITI